ncbi:MAG: CCA tRNA nucleotidyltransferase [Candidatus Rokubacteria bacterium]|nr:CCA tRNA nucleotidyltransferase [Candidatus Rokubacteria bacterium]
MARRAHVYPQVEPGAGATIDARVATLPAAASVAAALRVARKRDVGVLDVGMRGHVVLRADLARADALGLADLRAADLARPVPVVDAGASEVRVRRAMAAGAPIVLVVGRRGPIGAAMRPPALVSTPAMASAFVRRLPERMVHVTTLAAALAARQHAAAYVVGGVARDLFREARSETGDLDIVIEGDGHRLAREIAETLGAPLVLHDRFLTASVDVPGVGTVDVITARSERYEHRGALPRVMPAGIQQDLERRDFTINAMAIELTSDDRPLLDPYGGRADLERERIRILHPLSFVDDPTRMFRAARYAARLGFVLDTWTARCRRLALSLVPYPALSGPRIVAEVERILDDARPDDALSRLGRAGVFRLLDPDYRFTQETAHRVAQLAESLRWGASLGLAAAPVELALLVLLAEQPAATARRALARLGFSGEPSTRVERALDAGRTLPAALAAARTPSRRAALLRGRSAAEVAWVGLVGGAAARRAVEEFQTRTGAIASELRGEDVIALGVPRGPAVAQALAALRDARIDGEVPDRAGEAGYVRRWFITREEG